ncbi:hypothetical protein CEUSTIGMA_g2802.t1 [Chlamydomonas eustigma]|uniref:ABC transporter domain-containing protein n=1 Tax=Chlamydomonas eustigma TaxID=1157962 RepID=A0A250WWX8_9CHLO|nr:hypothetical protein CEUSTIGMA_g2802.t1 [Chlamydomonas eustigma]|eukprot:GAX75358.1 hypothetical protein CEUSTIGMA_g2802.t1 [Chlamydomonas eustigma]
MQTEEGTSSLQLWIPVILCAHFFSFSFLLHSWNLSRQGNAFLRLFSKKTSRKPSTEQLHQQSTMAPAKGLLRSRQLVSLRWFDLGCCYDSSNPHKVVLKGCYGKVCPGDMMALLGPSGSGKTTLLDMLALRKSLGKLSGKILMNEGPYDRASCQRLTAYIPQEEVLPPVMSCIEVMESWSHLVLPESMNKVERRRLVDQVLAALGLLPKKDVLVGGELPGGLVLKGLSGGEKKRLSVAAGLLRQPAVIFLDEPTTGLDSHSSLGIIKYLSAMAAAGHTIVASIHQPRALIWSHFSQVVVLSQGCMLYSGPRSRLVPWLTEGLGYGPYNPIKHGVEADWVLDLVNIGFNKPKRYYGNSMHNEHHVEEAAHLFLSKYLSEHGHGAQDEAPGCTLSCSTTLQNSVSVHGVSQAAAGAVMNPASCTPQRVLALPGRKSDICRMTEDHFRLTERGVSWWTQVATLSRRELLLTTRNPTDVAGRTLLFSWVGILVGAVFYPRGTALSRLRSVGNAMTVETIAFNLLPYVYMSLYTSEKRFFIADAASGLYKISAFYVAKLLVRLPFAVINSLSMTLTVYGMAGLRIGGRNVEWGPAIAEHAVISTLGYLVASQVIQLSAYLTTNQDAAFMVAIAWTAVNLLLSDTILRFFYFTMTWFEKLKYLSAMWYTYSGLVRAQYLHSQYNCSSGLASNYTFTHLLPKLLPNMQSLQNPSVQRQLVNPAGNAMSSCLLDGGSVVEYFGASTLSSQHICICLLVYLIILHLASYAALHASVKTLRR